MTQKAIITNAVVQVEHPLSDFMFLYGPGTEIDMSCSLTWRGEFYVFGGNAQPTQVSKLGSSNSNCFRFNLEVTTPYTKLNKCKLERVGALDFPHRYGGCANVNDDSIYLCFSKEDSDLKRCRKGRNPLGNFEQISNSNFEHNNTRIAANEGKLVV